MAGITLFLVHRREGEEKGDAAAGQFFGAILLWPMVLTYELFKMYWEEGEKADGD